MYILCFFSWNIGFVVIYAFFVTQYVLSQFTHFRVEKIEPKIAYVEKKWQIWGMVWGSRALESNFSKIVRFQPITGLYVPQSEVGSGQLKLHGNKIQLWALEKWQWSTMIKMIRYRLGSSFDRHFGQLISSQLCCILISDLDLSDLTGGCVEKLFCQSAPSNLPVPLPSQIGTRINFGAWDGQITWCDH